MHLGAEAPLRRCGEWAMPERSNKGAPRVTPDPRRVLAVLRYLGVDPALRGGHRRGWRGWRGVGRRSGAWVGSRAGARAGSRHSGTVRIGLYDMDASFML